MEIFVGPVLLEIPASVFGSLAYWLRPVCVLYITIGLIFVFFVTLVGIELENPLHPLTRHAMNRFAHIDSRLGQYACSSPLSSHARFFSTGANVEGGSEDSNAAPTTEETSGSLKGATPVVSPVETDIPIVSESKVGAKSTEHVSKTAESAETAENLETVTSLDVVADIERPRQYLSTIERDIGRIEAANPLSLMSDDCLDDLSNDTSRLVSWFLTATRAR
jgi:hypothetical protein